MCSRGFKRISSFLLIAFLCTLLADGGECQCVYISSSTNPPLFVRHLGSKSIIVPKSTSYEIHMEEYENLEAYCESGFEGFIVYQRNYGSQNYNTRNSKLITLQCYDKVLMLGDLESEKQLQDADITCRGSVYSIFETRENLTNCAKYQSYALGAKLSTPIIQAAFCYDLENTNLRYVSLKLTNLSPVLENAKNSYPLGLNEQSLTNSLNRIDRIFQFPSNAYISETIDVEAQNNYWLLIANYELDSIVQISSYRRENFESFSSFFQVIWWDNLRKGNWRQFTKLLEKRARSATYNFFMGTSGTVRVPEKNECLGEMDLEIGDDRKTKVPQFIWAYIQPTAETDSEFVVIGYNSPYFEYFPKNKTVLCADMCDEIDWLLPMKTSRSISTLGVMYCCRVEEVLGKLDGFPLVKPMGTPGVAQAIVTP